MAIETIVRNVFGHFQNLNLLALREDLRQGHTVRQAWSAGTLLCPVSHGLATGTQVNVLRVMGQSGNVGLDCDYAAQLLGTEPAAVLRFVRFWDDHTTAPEWLLRQLEELWQERLEDAVAVQEMLQETSGLIANLLLYPPPSGGIGGLAGLHKQQASPVA